MVYQIDLEQVIASKNPFLLRLLPAFVLNYLKKILHVDQINEVMRLYGHLEGIEFLEKGVAYLDVQCEFKGLDKLAQDERYIFVSNHPLGGLDGLLLLHAIQRKFGDVRSLSNDFLLFLDPLKRFFVPVNKHGHQGSERYIAIRNAFDSNIQILNFPAGLCSREIKGKIQDLEWKPSFVKSAKRSGRSVVPVYFDGRNSDFFYKLSKWRTRLGIRLNLEMLFLVDEMFSKKGARFTAYIGEPISYEELNASSRNAHEWTQYIREKTYSLKPSK